MSEDGADLSWASLPGGRPEDLASGLSYAGSGICAGASPGISNAFAAVEPCETASLSSGTAIPTSDLDPALLRQISCFGDSFVDAIGGDVVAAASGSASSGRILRGVLGSVLTLEDGMDGGIGKSISSFLSVGESSPYGLLEYAIKILVKSFASSTSPRARECDGPLSLVRTVSCDDLCTESLEPFE